MYVSARRCKKRWLNCIWTVLPRTSVIRLCSPRYLHYCRFLRTRSSWLRVVGLFLHIPARCLALIASLQRCTVYHHSDSRLVPSLTPLLCLIVSRYYILSNRLSPNCGRKVRLEDNYLITEMFRLSTSPVTSSTGNTPVLTLLSSHSRWLSKIFAAYVIKLSALRIVLILLL
jgi:hypothetical protein